MRFLSASAAVCLVVAPARAQVAQTLNVQGTRGSSDGGGAALLLDCALQSDLVCTTGETLTFTRAGTGATCMATGLSEDTTVAAGPAANVACFNDVHGIRIVGAIKNELCASETFDDSVVGCDWLGVTMPATVTLDQDDAPLVGVDTLADKITDDDNVLAERVRQSVALSTAGKYREAVWLRDTAAHTASLQVEVDTAVTPTTQTCNVSVLTTNKRFDCVLDATGLTFANVETRIYPTVSTDGALQDDVFAWGAQLVSPSANANNRLYLLPYCRSTGAAATTCAEEFLNVPTADWRNAGGDVAIDFTPLWGSGAGTANADGAPVLGLRHTEGMLFGASGNSIRMHDGTNDITRSMTIAARATNRLGGNWQGGVMRAENVTDGTVTAGAYDGAFTTADGLRIGNFANAVGIDGDAYFKHLQIYSKPTTRGPTAPHFMYVTGADSTHATTPDSAAISVTGDIDIRLRIAATDWTPAVNKYVISKVGGGGQRGYDMYVQGTATGPPGQIALRNSTDGTNLTIATSTAAVAASDGAVKWIRATRATASGNVNFYTSDDGVAWTQLGTQVASAAGGQFDGTDALSVGAQTLGTQAIQSKVYVAEVRNGIDGPVVAKFDAGDGTPYVSTSFVSSTTGETWTLNGDAKLYR